MMITRFLVDSDIAMQNNGTAHISRLSSESQSALLSVGTDYIILPSWSLNLNLIKLAFNVITQHFRPRYHKPMLNPNKEAFDLLH